MKKLFAVAATATMLVGRPLVSTESIGSTAGLQGKRLAVISHFILHFSACTADKAMFAIMGVIAMIHAGNKLVEQDQIEDQAIRIGHRLSANLLTTHGAVLLPPNGTVASSDKPVTLMSWVFSQAWSKWANLDWGLKGNQEESDYG
jgi:hypothetical protein